MSYIIVYIYIYTYEITHCIVFVFDSIMYDMLFDFSIFHSIEQLTLVPKFHITNLQYLSSTYKRCDYNQVGQI